MPSLLPSSLTHPCPHPGPGPASLVHTIIPTFAHRPALAPSPSPHCPCPSRTSFHPLSFPCPLTPPHQPRHVVYHQGASATHILRSNTLPPSAMTSLELPNMHVLNRLIASESEAAPNRRKACFILCRSKMLIPSSTTHVFNQHTDHLLTDDGDLCLMTLERGAAEKLAIVFKSITPLESHPDCDQEEPESRVCERYYFI
jgi:hypothetical protein